MSSKNSTVHVVRIKNSNSPRKVSSEKSENVGKPLASSLPKQPRNDKWWGRLLKLTKSWFPTFSPGKASVWPSIVIYWNHESKSTSNARWVETVFSHRHQARLWLWECFTYQQSASRCGLVGFHPTGDILTRFATSKGS